MNSLRSYDVQDNTIAEKMEGRTGMEINMEEVRTAMRKLKKKKVAGADGITYDMQIIWQ